MGERKGITMAFEPITTQEQLDAVISERMKREKETAAKKYEAYTSPEKIKAIKEAHDKQLEDLNSENKKLKEASAKHEKEIAERDAKIKGYETDSVKTRIAHEAGLPYEAVGYIQGDDEESIKKSAETLKGLVGSGSTPPLADPESADVKNVKDVAMKNMLHEMKGE